MKKIKSKSICFENRGGIHTNKIIVIVLILFALGLVFGFILKGDFSGIFKFLPSFSKSPNIEPISPTSSNTMISSLEDLKNCVGLTGQPERQNGVRGVLTSKENYIYINRERTNLYLDSDTNEIILKRNALRKDVLIGKVNMRTNSVSINSVFLNEESSELKNLKNELPSIEDLNFLNNARVYPINLENLESLVCLMSGFDVDFGEGDLKDSLNKAINHAKDNSVEGRRCYCGDNCGIYGEYIYEISERKKIDPFLLLSLMMQESNCKFNAGEGSGGSSFGLMQISLGGLDECKSELNIQNIGDIRGETNIKNNIFCGGIILYKKYGYFGNGKDFKATGSGTTSCFREQDTFYYGWEAALRGYVGWGCPSCPSSYNENICNTFKKGHDDYVESIIKRFNQLKIIAERD